MPPTAKKDDAANGEPEAAAEAAPAGPEAPSIEPTNVEVTEDFSAVLVGESWPTPFKAGQRVEGVAGGYLLATGAPVKKA